MKSDTAGMFSEGTALVSQGAGTSIVIDPGSGNDCHICAPLGCDYACSDAEGQPATGQCGKPGSSDPGDCCTCTAAPAQEPCHTCAPQGVLQKRKREKKKEKKRKEDEAGIEMTMMVMRMDKIDSNQNAKCPAIVDIDSF